MKFPAVAPFQAREDRPMDPVRLSHLGRDESVRALFFAFCSNRSNRNILSNLLNTWQGSPAGWNSAFRGKTLSNRDIWKLHKENKNQTFHSSKAMANRSFSPARPRPQSIASRKGATEAPVEVAGWDLPENFHVTCGYGSIPIDTFLVGYSHP